jgi:hypothetical protein
MLVVLILSSSVLVEGVPFMKTSFDLGSESGFCIDIESSGSKIFYDSVLLSSCKQDQPEGILQNIRFEGTGPISIEGHKRCLEVKPKSGGWDVVFLPCSPHKIAQNFTWVQEGCMIKNDKVEHCLAAGSTVSSKGDSLTRILQVVDCSGVSGQLLSWDVHPNSSNTPLSCSAPRTGWNFPKWAAVIFVVFGLITCWCACWILFCPRVCREKQEQIELVYGRKSPTKISSDKSNEILRCPRGHEIRALPIQGKQSCSICQQLQDVEGTKVYVCPTCDWMVCQSCYRRGSTCTQSASDATQRPRVTSDDRCIQILVEKPRIKKASLKQKASAVDQPEAEEPSLFTRIKRNVFGTTEQAPADRKGERSIPSSPELLAAEIDAIRHVVRVVSGRERRGESRRDFRSPRDYYYSPRYKRRSKRYPRWSDSSSSSSWSEEMDNSPIRRSRRQRNRRPRRHRHSRRRRVEYD